MLIYFYSDRNYVLEGFEADYFVSDCLFNCSGHGTCDAVSKKCNCDLAFFGDGCQHRYTPMASRKMRDLKSVENP